MSYRPVSLPKMERSGIAQYHTLALQVRKAHPKAHPDGGPALQAEIRVRLSSFPTRSWVILKNKTWRLGLCLRIQFPCNSVL